MTSEEYKNLKSKVRAASKKFGIRDCEIEDFTQEIVLKWAKRGFKKGQTVDQSIIDILRQQSGRKGARSFDTRQKLKNAVGIDDVSEQRRPVEPTLDERGDTGNFKRLFRGTDRAVLVLITKWGFSEVEVADIFGVSCSRISQRYKGIQSRISARVKAQESKTQGEGKTTVEEVLREETGGVFWRLEPFEDRAMETGESW